MGGGGGELPEKKNQFQLYPVSRVYTLEYTIIPGLYQVSIMSGPVILVNVISELLSVGSNPLSHGKSKVRVILFICIGIIPCKIN